MSAVAGFTDSQNLACVGTAVPVTTSRCGIASEYPGAGTMHLRFVRPTPGHRSRCQIHQPPLTCWDSQECQPGSVRSRSAPEKSHTVLDAEIPSSHRLDQAVQKRSQYSCCPPRSSSGRRRHPWKIHRRQRVVGPPDPEKPASVRLTKLFCALFSITGSPGNAASRLRQTIA